MTVIAEGKTKVVVLINDNNVRLLSKSDITAGDGAKHDILNGKAAFSNTTTCNVFELLAKCGIPVAYQERDSAVSFIAWNCRMLPWEVVVRRIAKGSILKREPTLEDGQVFDDLRVEFYLKTSGCMWDKFELKCDDPLAEFLPTGFINLWVPNLPKKGRTHFLSLRPNEVYDLPEDAALLPEMEKIARNAFSILEHMWSIFGLQLADFKIEYGIDSNGVLRIADVIDNDSWRLLLDGNHLDKQIYRDGGSLSDVRSNYELVANLSSKFAAISSEHTRWFEEVFLRTE